MKYFLFIISAILIFLSFTIIQGCGVSKNNIIERQNEFAIKSSKMGLWNEAIMRWERIIEIDPQNSKAYNNLGVAYEAKGDFDKAMSAYKKAMELEPNNKVYLNNYIKFSRNYERLTGNSKN